jgi:hypothetical protein
MKRENLQRFLFVSTACLLSLPWLTPCVGIMSSSMVDSAHNSITGRDRPKERFSSAQLKDWAAKPGPKLTVIENRPLPPHQLIMDEDLSAANGGMDAPVPGTIVGKGASLIVDGVATALTWVDPVTWVFHDVGVMETTKPHRQLILSESPFMALDGTSLRFKRSGKNGPILLAKAEHATLTIITAEGKISASARQIHFSGSSNEIVLEGWPKVTSGAMHYSPDILRTTPMTLNWRTRRVSCASAVERK